MPSVQTLGPILLVCGSAAGQLLSPALARIAPWISGNITMATGVGFILTGAYRRLDPVAISGFVVIGAGIGIAYRAALVMLTRGSDPARQGVTASLYAGITYAVAALEVLCIGWIGKRDRSRSGHRRSSHHHRCPRHGCPGFQRAPAWNH